MRAPRIGRWLLAIGTIGLLSLTAYASVREPAGRSRVGRDQEAMAMEGLASELSARERSIARREKTLAEREAELLAIEARLQERTRQLEALRAEIDGLRTQVDGEHAQKVSALVKTVASMKPAAAGAMMQELDLALATEVMRAMSPTKAAKLLAAMPPAFSAQLTQRVVGPGGAVGDKASPQGAP